MNITRPNVVSRSEDEIVYVTSVGKEFKARESFPTSRLRLYCKPFSNRLRLWNLRS